jgi:hypothetical protein
MLLQRLEHTFGAIPDPLRSRIESAEAETLLRGCTCVSDAERLEPVLD